MTFLRAACRPLTWATTLSEYVDGRVRAFRRKATSLPRVYVNNARIIRWKRKRRQARQSVRFELLLPFRFGQVRFVGRQRLVDGSAAGCAQCVTACFIVVVDLREPFVRGVLDLRLQHHWCFTEIFEQRVHPLLKERQPVLHARMAAPFGDGLIKHVVALRRTELRDIAHAETADRLGDKLEFGYGHEIEAAHIEQRAL